MALIKMSAACAVPKKDKPSSACGQDAYLTVDMLPAAGPLCVECAGRLIAEMLGDIGALSAAVRLLQTPAATPAEATVN